MNRTRMMTAGHSGLSLLLFLTLAGCAALFAPSIQSNVPPDRLTPQTYTSPDGGYTIAVPRLTQPGIWIEELIVGPSKQGIRFSDETGQAYRVLRIENAGNRYSLELISEESKGTGLYREISQVQSDHGRELRLAGLKKEGSRLATQVTEKDQTVTRQLDLYKADSVFIRGGYVYEVSAGVIAAQGKSEEALFEEAKSNLEVFLKGVSIK